MRILLTGATGFIGSRFMRLALSRGHEVAGLARSGGIPGAGQPAHPNAVWLSGTLADAPWDEIAAFHPEVCVHAAWITTPGIYLDSPENRDYLAASVDFLRRARKAGIGHIVGLGTCVEYEMSKNVLSEDRTPIAPASLYARCKNELRLALEADAAAGGFLFSWARIFYPYGPGEHPLRLCSFIAQKLLTDEPVVLNNPDSIKDYIFIEDLAAALVALIEKRSHGAINLGTGTGVTVREVAHTIGKILQKENLIREGPKGKPDPFERVVADASKLHLLGWRPAGTLFQGLEELVAARAGAGRRASG
jgi:nucleoside-diphosphate-sugar epimerase